MSYRPPVPEGWEFRLSPDRRLFAFYDPGNGPWFVPEPAMRGRFVDSPDMDALNWYRYVPEPDEAPVDRAAVLREGENTLREKAGQLSELAEESMRRDLEETAQVWHEAASALAQLATEPPVPEKPAFNSAERAMLRYALELVDDRIASEGDEFTDADRAAVESLKRFAGEAPVCQCGPAPHREEDGTYSHWAGCPVADAEQRAAERS